jgi:hypothetical protein
LEGSGRGLIDVISLHLLDESEENHENPQSGWPVFQLRLELSTIYTNVERYHYTVCLLPSLCWRRHVLRNVGWLSTDCSALYPRRLTPVKTSNTTSVTCLRLHIRAVFILGAACFTLDGPYNNGL